MSIPQADEHETWIRQFFHLALFTAVFHLLEFTASLLLWMSTNSAALMSFGLDALVSAIAALCLAARIEREWRNRFVAFGYLAASAGAVYLGGAMLWRGDRAAGSVLGIVLGRVHACHPHRRFLHEDAGCRVTQPGAEVCRDFHVRKFLPVDGPAHCAATEHRNGLKMGRPARCPGDVSVHGAEGNSNSARGRQT